MQNLTRPATFSSLSFTQNTEISPEITKNDPNQHFKKVDFCQAEKPNSDKNEEITVLSINSAKFESTSKDNIRKKKIKTLKKLI